jgi:hypothetical protein
VHLVAVAIAIGAAIFFVSEYTTHRFLFHAPPSRASKISRLQERLHYKHHLEPGRLDLLFLPPWFVVPAAAIFGGLYAIVVRRADVALSLWLGSLAGLLYYEWVHYVAHVPYVPKTRAGRFMKKYHLWHHFKNERKWFGVTNPAMDFAAGSYARVAEVEKSPTTRALFD